MRCHGAKRYALRCRNQARIGCVTCGVHKDQEEWVRIHFPDRICEEGGTP